MTEIRPAMTEIRPAMTEIRQRMTGDSAGDVGDPLFDDGDSLCGAGTRFPTPAGVLGLLRAVVKIRPVDCYDCPILIPR